jgi:16S rRNA (cytosine1402-N4)-methyltransferase
MTANEHIPVLLDEVIAGLAVRPDGVYVDATFGRGGHARAILAELNQQGRLLAIDKDPTAVQAAKHLFAADPRCSIEQGSFADLNEFVKQHNLIGKVDGILLDLGVSSPQLDDPERGFSFLRDGPLDMRMDPSKGISAATWLGTVTESVLAQVFKEYGEERYAKRIARAIVRERLVTPIVSTGRLAEIIRAAHPAWEKGKHPATRCFQAIRLFINRELQDLNECLDQCLDVLAVGGRLLVISFHSLEDRIVKRFMRNLARGDHYPAGLPITQEQLQLKLRTVGRAIKPSFAEITKNPRARSAVLRIGEKLS